MTEPDAVRLARLEEKVDAVKSQAAATQALVIGILVTTLGTLLAAGAGLVIYLAQRA